MTTLTEFLLSRIAEDEGYARKCAEAYPPPWEVADRGWMATVKADEPAFRIVTELDQKHAPATNGGWLGDYIFHIARWDPARVLTECAAKRWIVEQAAAHSAEAVCSDECVRYGCGKGTLRFLAAAYASHLDFDPSWAVEEKP